MVMAHLSILIMLELFGSLELICPKGPCGRGFPATIKASLAAESRSHQNAGFCPKAMEVDSG